MTNLDWVKEHQKDAVRKALYREVENNKDDLVDCIIDTADVIKEAIAMWYDIDLTTHALCESVYSHVQHTGYLTDYADVKAWLGKERALEPAYPVGTVIKNSHGNWYFYNGVRDSKHLVVDSPQYVGKKCGVMYYDESFKETFTPVRALSVSDRYTEQIYAPVHKQ